MSRGESNIFIIPRVVLLQHQHVLALRGAQHVHVASVCMGQSNMSMIASQIWCGRESSLRWARVKYEYGPVKRMSPVRSVFVVHLHVEQRAAVRPPHHVPADVFHDVGQQRGGAVGGGGEVFDAQGVGLVARLIMVPRTTRDRARLTTRRVSSEQCVMTHDSPGPRRTPAVCGRATVRGS